MHVSPLQIMIILMVGGRTIIIRTYLTWLSHTSRKSRLEKRGSQKMSHLQRVVVDHLSKLAKAVQWQQTPERLFLPYILPNVDIPCLILFMVVILNLVVLLFLNSFLDVSKGEGLEYSDSALAELRSQYKYKGAQLRIIYAYDVICKFVAHCLVIETVIDVKVYKNTYFHFLFRGGP
jgi:hypothetical protein